MRTGFRMLYGGKRVMGASAKMVHLAPEVLKVEKENKAFPDKWDQKVI